MTETRQVSDYFLGALFGIILGLTSLGAGLAVIIMPDTNPILGAAWAWAIGAGTIQWVQPWVKRAFKPVEVDA